MTGSKFAKAFMIGMCITVFSSTSAFASSGGGQPASVQGQQAGTESSLPREKAVEEQQAVLPTIAADSPDAAVSSMAPDQPPVNEEMLKKQSEIDQYLFEQHKDEIAEKDFVVTHTAPFDDYVEIGITPYNEANAEFLYKIFGKDDVKVVEGQQAVLLGLEAGGSNAAELYTASDAAKEVGASSTGIASPLLVPLAGAAGAVLVLGGTAVVLRRRKAASR